MRRPRLEGLVKKGLLRAEGDGEVKEWIIPGNEDILNPPPGYVVSFIHFHERGLGTPAHQFLRRLLYYYKIQLQHLTPNGIKHMSAFVALCEGYLGIKPHFELWKYFFLVALHNRTEQAKQGNSKEKKEYLVPMGSANIRLRSDRAAEYMSIPLKTSHKGWHSRWFYVRDDTAAPLPPFTNSYLSSHQQEWSLQPNREERRITDHLCGEKSTVW